MNPVEKLSADDYAKVLVTILLSAVVGHYAVQIAILMLGGHPRFEDTHSLMVNAGVTSFFLSIGWATRQVLLVSGIYLVFGLCILIPYFFALKGTWNTWLMQIFLYTGLPTLSTATFLAVSRMAGVPARPRRLKSGERKDKRYHLG